MKHPNTLARPTEYGAGRRHLGRQALQLERQRRLALLLLAIVLLLALLPVGWSSPMQAGLWLLVVGLALGSGALLGELFRPERLVFRRITEACSQLSQQPGGPDRRLDQVTHMLHTLLQPASLTLWQVEAADSVLHLLRSSGVAPPADLAELPLDVVIDQLHGTQPVDFLPESALAHGLRAAGVETVTALRAGGVLIGVIGYGPGLALPPGRAAFEWLSRAGGQVALLVQAALLEIEVQQTGQKLHLAYRRTIDAQDEERRSLATELHDDILGRLTRMAVTLRQSQDKLAAEPENVRGWLENLEGETQSINRRLREITQGLHPSVLQDLGLISALRAYMDSLARQPHSEAAPRLVSLTAQGFTEQRLAGDRLERDLYYITRQALDNAIKHAQAEQVFIHLRWDTDAVSVTVRDTGQGMRRPPAAAMGHNGHLGLLSMQERALAWQGKLSIHSDTAQGTTIRARVPIEQPSPAPAQLQAYTRYLQG